MAILRNTNSLLARAALFFLAACCCASLSSVHAQTDNSPFPQPTELQQGPPLTNQEFVRMLYQLPGIPSSATNWWTTFASGASRLPSRPDCVRWSPRRAATTASLIHTLEEAGSTAHQPTVATLPPDAESLELLERTRKATLGAADKCLTIW